jgi:TorA maturation chaperone TorD
MSLKNMSLQAQLLKTEDNLHQAASMQELQSAELNQQLEQQYRASAYSILAALLRGIPTQETLDHIAQFSKVEIDEDELLLSMSTLGLAAQSSDLSAVDDEFHELFVGLGRGELVPYGSWYLTGYLMEQPLSILRDDLKTLGFERDEDVIEPEDHVAALCEVMVMLISENAGLDGVKVGKDDTQSIFFEKHISSWMERFFNDLSEAKSAVFYRAVGRFGAAFINFEKQYLLV